MLARLLCALGACLVNILIRETQKQILMRNVQPSEVLSSNSLLNGV